MLYALLAQGELKIQSGSQKLLGMLSISQLLCKKIQKGLKKAGMKAVVKKKRPIAPPCHWKERGFCYRAPAMDLEEGFLVR